jgi:hypothetical protein
VALSPSQRELLQLLAAGWTATVFRDDPRTVYRAPRAGGGLCAESRRGRSQTVLSLLVRGLIEVEHNEPDRHSSMNGKLIGGATRYRITDKGRGLLAADQPRGVFERCGKPLIEVLD